MSEPKVEYWDCDEGAEELRHRCMHDAIEYCLDGMHPDPLPETVEVHGFARMQLNPAEWSGWRGPLESFLENLDEDYGHPTDYTTPTDTMRKAERAFVEAVLREYEVWRCYKVCTETVNVAEWVRENRPEWLESQG